MSSALFGQLLPESILHTHWFTVLAGFVAVNTILYVSLSIFKIMPKLYKSDIVSSRRPRAETRSIYPNGKGPPADYRPAPGSLAARHPMFRDRAADEGASGSSQRSRRRKQGNWKRKKQKRRNRSR